MSDNYSIFTVIHSFIAQAPPLSHSHQQLHYFLNQTKIIPKTDSKFELSVTWQKDSTVSFCLYDAGKQKPHMTDKTITYTVCKQFPIFCGSKSKGIILRSFDFIEMCEMRVFQRSSLIAFSHQFPRC